MNTKMTYTHITDFSISDREKEIILLLANSGGKMDEMLLSHNLANQHGEYGVYVYLETINSMESKNWLEMDGYNIELTNTGWLFVESDIFVTWAKNQFRDKPGLRVFCDFIDHNDPGIIIQYEPGNQVTPDMMDGLLQSFPQTHAQSQEWQRDPLDSSYMILF